MQGFYRFSLLVFSVALFGLTTPGWTAVRHHKGNRRHSVRHAAVSARAHKTMTHQKVAHAAPVVFKCIHCGTTMRLSSAAALSGKCTACGCGKCMCVCKG